MAKDIVAKDMNSRLNGESGSFMDAFETKIREFQSDLKGLTASRDLEDLKRKWSEISSKTLAEIEEHPLQMVALAGMLGFSLGIAGKSIDVRGFSSKALDWAAKFGATWAVDKLADRKAGSTDRSVH